MKTDYRKTPIRGDFATRFWGKVNKDGPTPAHAPELGPCWIWLASTDGIYGHVRLPGGRMQQAHRAAWELQSGKKLPPTTKLCHRCDTPLCVRPSHTFLGTQADNLADMRAKGRGAQGERNGAARLGTDQVQEIRTAFQACGGYGAQTRLAERFGVSLATINDIVRGRTWAHAEVKR